MNIPDYPVGRKFKHGDITLKVIDSPGCNTCFFRDESMAFCWQIICNRMSRSDEKDIHYERVDE